MAHQQNPLPAFAIPNPLPPADPSPLPTTAPHPRDVAARLHPARQLELETCAYANANITESITCGLDRKCVELTSFNVFGCCLSESFPNNCGTGQTSCIGYDGVAACTGACANNPAIVQCSNSLFPYCGVTVYDFSTLTHLLTGFSCAAVSTRVTAFPYYSLDNNVVSTAATIFQPSTVTVTASGGGGGGNGGNTNNNGSTPSTTLPSPSPTNTGSGGGGGGGGLSSGAKAGIAVGAVAAAAIIAGLIFFIFFQKRRTDRQRREHMPVQPAPVGPPPMSQYPQQQPPQQGQPLGSPPLNNQAHMSMASMPSATSSGAPLTQANVAAMSQSAPSEVLPSESASQIGGPGGSVLSGAQGANPGYGAASGTGSQEHSGLGPMPEYPTGASAFPHAQPGGASVLSGPSAFGSAPPVHAPSVAPFQGEQR